MQKDRTAKARKLSNLEMKVSKAAEERLLALGIQEEQMKKRVVQKYCHHLRGEEATCPRFEDQALATAKHQHERPPCLFNSNFEL